MSDEESEEEEEQYNNFKNKSINTYYGSYQKKYYKNNLNFSPRKTKLSLNLSEIKENKEITNYNKSKNKKNNKNKYYNINIPSKVMNLVSFINTFSKNTDNSISTINVLSISNNNNIKNNINTNKNINNNTNNNYTTINISPQYNNNSTNKLKLSKKNQLIKSQNTYNNNNTKYILINFNNYLIPNNRFKILPQKAENKIIKNINDNQKNKRERKKIYDYNKNDFKNDNIDLIIQKGKEKRLSNDEIKRETDKAQILEDMSTMGTIMKEQIIEEKKTNPEKFYTDEEIIKNKTNKEELFALGVLSKALENQGSVIAIEKDDSEDSKNNTLTTLEYLVTGMYNKNKYNLHFDFGESRNNQLLNDEDERKIFNDKLRKKISKDFNMKEEDILITFPREGSFQTTIIFRSEDFNLSEEELFKKFKNEKGDLEKLKKVEKGIILDGCKLTPGLLDSRGNNKGGGWAPKGEKRGGEEYIPPIGWTGYGLEVQGKYGDDTWLGMINIPGEWCVAYHGVARGQPPKEVAKITGDIFKKGFKPSKWGKITDDPDLRHPGKTCGLGVYCSPDISYIEKYDYAGKTVFDNEEYKCALMLRVNPQKIRQSTSWPEEYILEPSLDEIRPYRILLKKCQKE